MRTIVAVRKNGRIAIAKDFLTGFGETRVGIEDGIEFGKGCYTPYAVDETRSAKTRIA